jgi:diguanylate cyclase (GGDEF)-like protein/PAS domain S-box-containing protein
VTVDVDRYRPLLDQMFDAVYLVDRERRIVYWNAAAERLTGFRSDDVVGRSCADGILCHVDRRGQLLCQGACPLSRAMQAGQSCQDDIYLHHKDGHRLPIAVRCSPLCDDGGEVIGAMEVFNDGSAIYALQERAVAAEQLALIDPLTGLANRRHAEILLDVHLEELRRYGTPFAVILADIDQFKAINDAHGHPIADRVLTMVAGTFARNLRPFDTVARWGGDEFLAVLRAIDATTLAVVGDRLRRLVASSFLEVDGRRVAVTVSLGATVARGGETKTDVVSRADRCLYASKGEGRNQMTSG